jgi:hypothetical protein
VSFPASVFCFVLVFCASNKSKFPFWKMKKPGKPGKEGSFTRHFSRPERHTP